MSNYLIPMSNYVLITATDDVWMYNKEVCLNTVDKIKSYANFLKQPLKLSMFVPCDDDGKVLAKPSIYDPRSKTGNIDYEKTDEAEKEYSKALENVLFDEFSSELADWTDDFVMVLTNKYDENFEISFSEEGDILDHNGELTDIEIVEDLIHYIQRENFHMLKLNENSFKYLGI